MESAAAGAPFPRVLHMCESTRRDSGLVRCNHGHDVPKGGNASRNRSGAMKQ